MAEGWEDVDDVGLTKRVKAVDEEVLRAIGGDWRWNGPQICELGFKTPDKQERGIY